MGSLFSSRRESTDMAKERRKDILSEQEAFVLSNSDDDRAGSVHDSTDTSRASYLDLVRQKLERTHSYIDPVDMDALSVDPRQYKYPFENLIFEGGGNKGLAYVGALQCLEECGALCQIKRVAGASAGAITAALLAVGYKWEEIYDFLSGNIEDVFLDHSCGYLSLLPNLIRQFGWNPGHKIYDWFGDKIKTKSPTHNPDMTFYDLYKWRKIELCVVVTNLNLMSVEYCHPKTTPDMPIRDALRMTMSIPGVYSPIRYDNHGQQDTYVDGGVLCNYPIHCFDGWYLSMAPQDSFLIRCHPLKDLPTLMSPSNRFSPMAAHKSLGFLLFNETEREIMRYSLEKRLGSNYPERPERETKLFLEKARKKHILEKAEREHARTVTAVETFMQVLRKTQTHQVLHKNNVDELEYITKEELKAALDDEDFPQEQKDRLFGKGCDIDTAFKILDKDKNDKIAFFELVSFIEEHGIRMQTRFKGYGRRTIDSFFTFLDALQGTLLTNLKFVFVGESDENRTVGINTGHVGTSDYKLEEADREFTRLRGYHATHAYLRYFVVKHPEAVVKDDSTPVNGNTTCFLYSDYDNHSNHNDSNNGHDRGAVSEGQLRLVMSDSLEPQTAPNSSCGHSWS